MPTQKEPKSRASLDRSRRPQDGGRPANRSKGQSWPQSLPSNPAWFAEAHHILPHHTRETEQQYLDVRKRFFATTLFRQAIRDLRQRYPRAYWNQVPKWQRLSNRLNKEMVSGVMKLLERFSAKAGDAPILPSISFKSTGALRFRDDAKVLCQQFGLEERHWRWVEWLVRNWDPSTSDAPPVDHEPRDIQPDFYPWRITVTDFVTDGTNAHRRRVTLVLEEGATPTASSKAAVRAVQELPATRQIGRTPLMDKRNQLHLMFQHRGLNKKQATQVDFKHLAKSTSLSTSTIRKEYFKWAEPFGFKPEKYEGAVTHDRRTSS